MIPYGDDMGRENIEKIARTPEERMLLSKVWDKIDAGMRRNIIANTGFLSPSEQVLCQYLFGNTPGLFAFGGYSDAERKMLVYLPDYLDETALTADDSPICCLRAVFYEADSLSHRDFLGALMGSGIDRSCIGDICVGKGSCDFFVTTQIAPYILQNFLSAGRTKLSIAAIPLLDAAIPEPDTKEIRDTVASVRLDSIISSGFRISRGLAAQLITAGKASIDGLPCEKADKAVPEGAKISLRGYGKLKLVKADGLTKKGRIPVVIHRYI